MTYPAILFAAAVIVTGCAPVPDELKGHTDNVYWIGVTAKGDIAVSAGRDTAIVWDLPARRQLRTFGKGWCSGTLIPNSTLVCTGDERGEIVIWDYGTAAEVAKLSVPGVVTCLVSSPDGKLLAASVGYSTNANAKQAGYDYAIRVWDVTVPPSPTVKSTLSGHRGNIYGLGFSADSGLLYSASNDDTLRSWDVQKATQKNQEGEAFDSRTAGGANALHRTRNLAFGKDGQIALSNRLYTSDGLKVVLALSEDAVDGSAIALVLDSKRGLLWAGSTSGYLLGYDLATGKVKKRHRAKAHHGEVLWLAVTPDDKEILVGGRAGIPAFSALDRNVPRFDPSIKIYRIEAL